MSDLKKTAAEWLDGESARLTALSLRIWQLAELGLRESQSSAALAAELEAHGFRVERSLAGMPTAFAATWGEGGPTIGLLAEFDALPGISNAPEPQRSPIVQGGPGHGCGHNLIGTGSVAAAIAVRTALERAGRPGTIKVFGTPAEETLVGKVFMTRAGVFRGLDAVLTWHPQSVTRVADERCLALLSVKFAFHGRPCHIPSAPEAGRNALDAVELMNIAVNFRRKHMPPGVTVEYVVTEGGEFPNVSPQLCRVWYFLRAPRLTDVQTAYEMLLAAANGAATATGTTAASRVVTSCYGYLPNTALSNLLYRNLEAAPPEYTSEERKFARQLVRTLTPEPSPEASLLPEGAERIGEHIGPYSQDDGDLSWLCPLTTFNVAAWPQGVSAHTWQATASAGTTIGTRAMLAAAGTLALTTLDLFTDPRALAGVREEFRGRTKDFTYRSLVPADATAMASLEP